VNLKPGIYEVLPMIVAQRSDSTPSIEEVIKINFKDNPEKLKQIGMNYDIAHAKGGFEEEELQKKEKEKKKLAEKKKKEKEALAKEKEEKAKEETEAKPDAKETTEEETNKKEDDVKEEPKTDIKIETPDVAQGVETKDETTPDAKVEEPIQTSSAHQAPEPGLGNSNAEKQEEEAEEPQKKEKPAVEPSANPWNAVTVIGLLVYSKDPETKIQLIKPEVPEEES
jgi:hypothetical protein